MNRRGFLKGLLATVGAAVASRALPLAEWPLLPDLSLPSPVTYTVTHTVGNYADYVTVSDLVTETWIDPAVVDCAREISYRMALSLNALVECTADTQSDWFKHDAENGIRKSIERHQRKNEKRDQHRQSQNVLCDGQTSDSDGADLEEIQHVRQGMPAAPAQDPAGYYQFTEVPALL